MAGITLAILLGWATGLLAACFAAAANDRAAAARAETEPRQSDLVTIRGDGDGVLWRVVYIGVRLGEHCLEAHLKPADGSWDGHRLSRWERLSDLIVIERAKRTSA